MTILSMWRDLSSATSEVSRTGVGWALTAVSNGALASFFGVRMSAAILTQALFLKLPDVSLESTGSKNTENGMTGRTPRNQEILSTSIRTIRALPGIRTDLRITSASLKKSLTTRFTPLKATPETVVPRGLIPSGITICSDLGFLNID